MTDKYKKCNHHHELTNEHKIVDFWDWEFVANIEWIPLLKALNDLWIRTRTHHIKKGEHSFISIILDDISLELRDVYERDSDRTKYNWKSELLLKFKAK